MVEAKHVSRKNIFGSTFTVKSRGGKIFDFLHCPFEGRANMHHKIQPNWLTGRCCLAGGSKGQCRKSKIFLSLLLPMQVDQYIFFPETCFAPTISEPEFTVCTRELKGLVCFCNKILSIINALAQWVTTSNPGVVSSNPCGGGQKFVCKKIYHGGF